VIARFGLCFCRAFPCAAVVNTMRGSCKGDPGVTSRLSARRTRGPACSCLSGYVPAEPRPEMDRGGTPGNRYGDAAGSAGCQQSKSSGSCSAWQQVRDRPIAEVVSHLDLALPGQRGTAVV